MRWNEKNRTSTSLSDADPTGRPPPQARGTHRYDAARVMRRVLPLRVVVSLAVAFALIGAIVLAGVLFRHRDPGHHKTTTATTAATTRKGTANP